MTTTVRGEDWYGRDLSGETYVREVFVGADMTEVVNHGSTFDACTFRDVHLNVSTHVDAAFLNAGSGRPPGVTGSRW